MGMAMEHLGKDEMLKSHFPMLKGKMDWRYWRIKMNNPIISSIPAENGLKLSICLLILGKIHVYK